MWCLGWHLLLLALLLVWLLLPSRALPPAQLLLLVLLLPPQPLPLDRYDNRRSRDFDVFIADAAVAFQPP